MASGSDGKGKIDRMNKWGEKKSKAQDRRANIVNTDDEERAKDGLPF